MPKWDIIEEQTCNKNLKSLGQRIQSHAVSFTVPTKTFVFPKNTSLEFHLIWSAPEVVSSKSVTAHPVGPSSSSWRAGPQQLLEAHGACFWEITTHPGKAWQKHGNQAFSQATSDRTRGNSLKFAGQSPVGYHEKFH